MADKAKLKQQLQIARKTWDELHALPDWIEDDYEWYIELDEEKYYVIYVDPSSDYIELLRDKTGKQKEYGSRSKYWSTIINELAITAPSKCF
jgi:hypothetical protein